MLLSILATLALVFAGCTILGLIWIVCIAISLIIESIS